MKLPIIDIALSSLVLSMIVCTAGGQTKGKAPRASLDSSKPTAYLEFVKLGKKEFARINRGNSESPPPQPPTEVVDTVWLRVRNNSRWGLQFTVFTDSITLANAKTALDGQNAFFVAKNNAEFELSYYVEPVNAEVVTPHKLDWKVPYRRLFNSLTTVVVPSGSSAIFVVRRAELDRNLQISLPFKYEWEWSVKDPGYGEPEHRVSLDWAKFENAAGIT